MYINNFITLTLLCLFTILATLGLTQPRSADLDNDAIWKVPYESHWYLSNGNVTLKQLVEEFAPVLWFSPQEKHWPKAFPFTESATGERVVHYVISLGGQDFTKRSEERISELIKSEVDLKLEYFLYYPEETGLGEHLHDLEGMVVKLKIKPCNVTETSYCDPGIEDYLVQADLIVGLAHGHFLYDNQLAMGRAKDTKFPLVLLIEEGKHASCPDRDQNGVYTPGYDVNRHFNDAWGVRDIISTGGLYISQYATWMTKNREELHQWWPEDSSRANSYSLKIFPDLDGVDKRKHHDLLKKINEKRHPSFLQRFSRLSQRISLGYRYDGQHQLKLATFLPQEVPIFGGFAGAKVSTRLPLNDGFLLQALYLPSAARWLDWYTAVGAEKTPGNWRAVLEYGYKFRATLAKLGLFASFTLGLKAYSEKFPRLTNTNLVFEVGLGGI